MLANVINQNCHIFVKLIFFQINDHDMIHYRNSLCRLPASTTVRTILDDFVKKNSPKIITEQTVNFLIGCFDR